jgi:hypothetical protein
VPNFSRDPLRAKLSNLRIGSSDRKMPRRETLQSGVSLEHRSQHGQHRFAQPWTSTACRRPQRCGSIVPNDKADDGPSPLRGTHRLF